MNTKGIAAGMLLSTTSQKLVTAPRTSAFRIVLGLGGLERKLVAIRTYGASRSGTPVHILQQGIQFACNEGHSEALVSCVAHGLRKASQSASIE
jgi:hypothetical protein